MKNFKFILNGSSWFQTRGQKKGEMKFMILSETSDLYFRFTKNREYLILHDFSKKLSCECLN